MGFTLAIRKICLVYYLLAAFPPRLRQCWQPGRQQCLAILGFIFLIRAIGIISNACIGQTTITDTEFAVLISDFLTVPAWIIGGIIFWRRKEFGYIAGQALPFQLSMLFAGLIVFMLIQPLFTGKPFAIADVVTVALMGMICFIPFILFIYTMVLKRSWYT